LSRSSRHLTLALGAALSVGAILRAPRARADSLDAGKELYHQLDYPAARMELIRAASLPEARRRAEAYLYLGLINVVEGDLTAAKQSFRAAVSLDASLQVPPGTSPKVRKVFEDVANEIVHEEEESAPGRPTVTAPAPSPAPVPPPATIPAPRSVTVIPLPEPGPPGVASVPSPAARPSIALPIGLLAAGAIAAGIGIAFGVQELADEAAFHSATVQANAVAARNNANTHAVVADACYAAAAALGIAGGAVWVSF